MKGQKGPNYWSTFLFLVTLNLANFELRAIDFIQSNTFKSPGFIVTIPNDDGLTISAYFVPTDTINVGSIFKATGILPSGEKINLREFETPQSYYSVSSWVFPLVENIVENNIDGVSTKPLPVGSSVQVSIKEILINTSIRNIFNDVFPGEEITEKIVTTGWFIWGAEISQDYNRVTIYGNFTPGISLEVFVGFWYEPIDSQALTIFSDKIIIAIEKDKRIKSLILTPAFYPVTVRQKNLCDTIVIRLGHRPL